MPNIAQTLPEVIRKVNIKEEKERLLGEFKTHVKTVPIISLIYNIIFIVIFILNWALPTEIFHYGSLNTSLTFYPQEFFEGKGWSLFTYTWININLVNLVFSLIFFHLIAYNLEKKWGTIKFIYLTLFFFTLIPALLDSLIFITFTPDTTSAPLPTTLYGNFVLFFTFLVIEILELPKVSFFGAFKIPAPVYPVILLLVLSFISSESFLHGLLGALMAYLFSYNFFGLLIPSNAKIESFEKRFLPSFIYNNPHYCTAENTTNFSLPLYTVVTNPDWDSSEGSSSQSYSSASTNGDPFKSQSSRNR